MEFIPLSLILKIINMSFGISSIAVKIRGINGRKRMRMECKYMVTIWDVMQDGRE